MKKIIVMAILVIAIASGGFYLYQTQWKSPPPRTFLLIGGILEGDGSGTSLSQYLRNIFEEDDIPFRIVDARSRALGVAEYRQLLKNRQLLEEHRPVLVLFVSDPREARGEEENIKVLPLVREIRQLNREIQAHRNPDGSKPLFFLSNLPLPPKGKHGNVDDAYRQRVEQLVLPAINRVGREEEVHVVNLYGFFRRHPGMVTGEYLGPEGCRRMASYIYRQILPFIKGISGPGEEKLPGQFQGKIVFQSDRHGNEDLFLLDHEGVHPLTTHPEEDSYPVLSPKGDRMVFESRRSGKSEIYWMDLKEKEINKLFDSPTEDHYPFWTYDGDFIYFNRMVQGKEQVFRYEWEGGEIRKITDFKGRNALPAVNPSNTKMLVTSNRLIGWQIHCVNLKTGQITEFSREYGGCRSRFSHDGQTIAWVSHKADHKGDIYLTPSEELNPLRLTTNSEKHDYYPAFSPDDRFIVYASGPHLKTGNYDLMIIEIATSKMWRITTAPSKDILPYWSK